MNDADLSAFDEIFYLQRYDDVAQAVSRGECSSGYAHYCRTGRAEGRDASPEIDEGWYQKTYPNARRDIEAGLASDFTDHYRQLGRHRGYLPNFTAPRPGNSANFRSRFGGLWIDQANAPDLIRGKLQLGTITQDQAAMLFKWIEDGYIVIGKAVPDDILEEALSDLTRAYEGGFPSMKFNVFGVGENKPWVPQVQTNPTKGLDLHWLSEKIRDAIFCDKVLEFLHLLFERPVLASQTLSFWRGSAQDGHQDSAFVNYSLPMQFAACWIALEDVHGNAGELFYHVGGHRMPEYLYGPGLKGAPEAVRLDPALDVGEPIQKHVQSIKMNAKGMSLKTDTFLAKRGDVLFWSADLPHGGKAVSTDFTRKSVVTHYCPSEVAPAYFERQGGSEVRQHGERGFYSSRIFGKAKK